MFILKHIALFAIFIGLVNFSLGYKLSEDDPCLALRKCSLDEIIVHALTPDNQCVLFRNDCHFLNDLCQRRENDLPALKIINKKECKTKCSSVCPFIYSPVCAEHKGVLQTFANQCVLQSTACTEDKSFMFTHSGECVESITEDEAASQE